MADLSSAGNRIHRRGTPESTCPEDVAPGIVCALAGPWIPEQSGRCTASVEPGAARCRGVLQKGSDIARGTAESLDRSADPDRIRHPPDHRPVWKGRGKS